MPTITKECPCCNKVKPISEYTYRRGRGEHYFNCQSCDRKFEALAILKYDNQSMTDPRFLLLERSLSNALETGKEHRLTLEDIPTPSVCVYLNLTLEYRTLGNKEARKKRADNLASIDRIDSSQGYVPGNVQTISYLANRMKQDATIEQLLQFAQGILKTHS